MGSIERKKRYLANKRYTCRKGKIDRAGNPVSMLLDMNDLDTLLEQAGITIWDVGLGHGKYCLARVKDLGDYAVGNCRFVTTEENNAEYWDNLTEDEKEAQRQLGRDNGILGKEYGYLGGKPIVTPKTVPH
jgi:hypothetical protein